MTKGLLGMSLAAALAWAAGCGGNVVVDGQGGEGASSSTTGSGTPQTRCSTMCDLLASSGCSDTTTCPSDCLGIYDAAPGCVPEVDAYIDCIIANFSPSCAPPLQCLAVAEQLAVCVAGTNPSPGCADGVECYGGSDGSCGCKGLCNGVEASVDCAPGPSGAFDCICAANGTQVGTCQEASPTCDIQSGCCAPFIFGFGGE